MISKSKFWCRDKDYGAEQKCNLFSAIKSQWKTSLAFAKETRVMDMQVGLQKTLKITFLQFCSVLL